MSILTLGPQKCTPISNRSKFLGSFWHFQPQHILAILHEKLLITCKWFQVGGRRAEIYTEQTLLHLEHLLGTQPSIFRNHLSKESTLKPRSRINKELLGSETAQKPGLWKKIIIVYLIGHWARQRREIIVMRVIQTSSDFAGDTNPAKYNQIPSINACQHKYFQHWHNSRKP